MRFLLLILFILSPTVFADNIALSKTEIRLGFLYLQKGFDARAKAAFFSALSASPHHAFSWDAMGYYLEKTGDMKNATVYFSKALRISPASAAANNNMGVFLCQQKKYQVAMAYFLKAAHTLHYLHTANAYENAGLCALKMKNKIAAQHYFQMAKWHGFKTIAEPRA